RPGGGAAAPPPPVSSPPDPGGGAGDADGVHQAAAGPRLRGPRNPYTIRAAIRSGPGTAPGGRAIPQGVKSRPSRTHPPRRPDRAVPDPARGGPPPWG